MRVLIVGVVLLAACEPVKTVTYYSQNKMEAKVKIEQCTDNPGMAKYQPNCENAQRSASANVLSTKNTKMPSLY